MQIEWGRQGVREQRTGAIKKKVVDSTLLTYNNGRLYVHTICTRHSHCNQWSHAVVVMKGKP